MLVDSLLEGALVRQPQSHLLCLLLKIFVLSGEAIDLRAQIVVLSKHTSTIV